MTRWPLFLLFLTLTGCAQTLAEFREKPTESVGTVPGHYLSVASCLQNGLEQKAGVSGQYRLQDLASEHTASLVGYGVAPSGTFHAAQSPFIELVIYQREPHLVSVAARAVLKGKWDILPVAQALLPTCAARNGDTAQQSGAPTVGHPTAPAPR